MATRFDQLQSRSRPTGADLYSPDLLGYSRGATPPYQMAGSPTGPKIPPLPVVPMSDPYSRWFNHPIAPISPVPDSDLPAAKPGERLGGLPPSLNAPYGQVAENLPPTAYGRVEGAFEALRSGRKPPYEPPRPPVDFEGTVPDRRYMAPARRGLKQEFNDPNNPSYDPRLLNPNLKIDPGRTRDPDRGNILI